MTLLLAAILLVFLFIASVTAILFFVGPTILLQPRRRTPDFYRALGQPITPSDIRLAYEEINVPVEVGLKLNCWLIKSPPPANGTIIYLHGVADCKIDGIRFAQFMRENRFNVFLFDARRHGESDGKFCTYGYYEKDDVRMIIDYISSRQDLGAEKVGLFGTSMGAAVALQAAALDNRISAVVAENSFATLRSIFDDYQKRMIKLPFHYLRNIVIKRSETMASFRASEVSPLEAVKRIRIPLLIVYGSNDRLIKPEYSEMLYEAASGPKEIFPIHAAAHNDTWRVAGEGYERKVIEFFEKHLQ